MDSTTISLCLSLFDCAKFRKKKGAIKLHTLLDYDGCLPTSIDMTDGKVHDATAAKKIVLPAESVVVPDRAYVDFETLYRWHRGKSYFVVPFKDSIKFNRLEERELPDNRHQHILGDEYMNFLKKRPGLKLRRVVVWDDENKQTIEIITNQFNWTANTIGDLYKARWEIEIFFKDIKQLLKIKSF